jgi:origin recognition complex subunit 5
LVAEVTYPFIHDPLEIEYIAAARWPGFVKPVLDEFLNRQQQHLAPDDQNEDGMDVDEETLGIDLSSELQPPSENTRLRLSRYFSASLTQAMEELYPRLTNAVDWAAANTPPSNVLSTEPSAPKLYDPANPFASPVKRSATVNKAQPEEDAAELSRCLPRLSKFIVVAAFLASTNPANSDWRMFGRGLDEKKRKRRVLKTVKTSSGPAKVFPNIIDFSIPSIIIIYSIDSSTAAWTGSIFS